MQATQKATATPMGRWFFSLFTQQRNQLQSDSLPFREAAQLEKRSMCETFTRPGYGEQAMIVVPKTASSWSKMIVTASAIVAFKNDAEHLVIYYEGNLYGASNLRRFEDRALIAYGRLTQRAPTIAMAVVPVSEFVLVGHMTPERLAIQERDRLEMWLQGVAA